MTPTTRWGPIRSLLALSPVLIGAPFVALYRHYSLPQPLTELTNNVTGLPQISEPRILGFAKELSEDIGYRTVGTYEHALADAWMVKHAEEVKSECERVVKESGYTRKLECEVWRQEGSGSHRFDMMAKRLYKTYVNVSNIVVRISDGTPEGKEHAVLVNAHLDSTLPSPGAADDAISVGVMLDCMRVLVNTPGWSPRHAIIFLFNHAEESLQDGSHLFSTQHPVAHTIRAAINLEAAGTTGRELLFQATSEQMIEAYSHVPRPYGTVFANEVFSSGILLSDTDFRQFEEYLNVTGLDMAIVGNSYLYHMRKDLVENIEAGVAQHMAENTLGLLTYLSSSESPLPTLTDGYVRPTTVFFAHIFFFVVYSFRTAKIMYSALFAACILFAWTQVQPSSASEDKKKSNHQGNGFASGKSKAKTSPRTLKHGLLAVVFGTIGTLLVPNLVAFIMHDVLGKGMSWFSSPMAPIGLYGPPAVLGALLSQLLLAPIPDFHVITSLLLIQSGIALGLQLMNIGSACLFFLAALPLFIVLTVINPLLAGDQEISLLSYALGQAMPLCTGTLVMIPVAEVFVPLTGRIGAQAPADHIIATIVAVIGAQSLPLVVGLSHRFGRKALYRGVFITSMISIVMMAVFAMRKPFDEMHQKRLFVLHLENITTHEQHLHIAAADGAPGFDLLVKDIVKEFGAGDQDPLPVIMDEYNSDWDPLYPFSSFLEPYKVPLSVEPNYVSPWTNRQAFTVEAVDDIKDFAAGTRSLKLKINHPGLIWTVIAFDAHVLKWTLDNNPPDEFVRHHIKEASFYGTDVWSIDLVVKLPVNESSGASIDGGIMVNFMGLQEKGMWPGKKAVKAEGGLAMQLFEQLDGWLEEKTGGTVDALLLGCVAGAIVV